MNMLYSFCSRRLSNGNYCGVISSRTSKPVLQRSRRTAQTHTAALRIAFDEAPLNKDLTQQQQERYTELQAEQEQERMDSAEVLFSLSHGAKLSIDKSEAAWAELSRRVLDKHYRGQLQRITGSARCNRSIT